MFARALVFPNSLLRVLPSNQRTAPGHPIPCPPPAHLLHISAPCPNPYPSPAFPTGPPPCAPLPLPSSSTPSASTTHSNSSLPLSAPES